MTNLQELQAQAAQAEIRSQVPSPKAASQDGAILSLAVLIDHMATVPNQRARIWSKDVLDEVEVTATINPVKNVTRSLYRKGYLMKQVSTGKLVLSSMGERLLKSVHWNEFDRYVSGEVENNGSI